MLSILPIEYLIEIMLMKMTNLTLLLMIIEKKMKDVLKKFKSCKINCTLPAKNSSKINLKMIKSGMVLKHLAIIGAKQITVSKV